MNPLYAIRKHLETINSSSRILKNLESISPTYAIKKHLELNSISTSIKRNFDIQISSNNFQNNLQDILSKSSIDKYINMLGIGNNYKMSMTSWSQHDSFYKSIAALAQPAYFQSAVNIFNKQSLPTETLIEQINVEVDEEKIEERLSCVSNSSDLSTFSIQFEKLPGYIQLIIIFIFMQILLPQLNNITANLVTPYVEEYLSSSSNNKNIKIKEISVIAKREKIETTRLRFITGDNVRLRFGPSTSSEILDELQLGQVVTVLSKKKNWIEVQYSYDNNEILHGWVFTRYTAKFKK